MPTASSGEPVAPSLPASEPGIARSAADPRPGLSGLPAGALEEWLGSQGQPSYRARQIRDAVWGGFAAGSTEMRTLPVALREALDRDFRVDAIVAEEVAVA